MIATKTRSRRPWRGGKEGYGGQFYTRLTGGAVGEVGDRDSRVPCGGVGRWFLAVTSMRDTRQRASMSACAAAATPFLHYLPLPLSRAGL